MKKPGTMIREVLRHVGAKPATEQYPFVKNPMPPHFRGKIEVDTVKCIGCKMCERDCPTGAIAIAKMGNKRFQATLYHDKCIYCAQCVDSCPVDAISFTSNYELAAHLRATLTEVFDAPPEKPATEGESKEEGGGEKAAKPVEKTETKPVVEAKKENTASVEKTPIKKAAAGTPPSKPASKKA
jgi:formate hydrogenlyase subunit 6/NADH:ubiquinone oxidoreductase subunit I